MKRISNAESTSISASATSLDRIRPWRDTYRLEMSCQIIHDSIHDRPGWTQEYDLSIAGAGVGWVAGDERSQPPVFRIWGLASLVPSHPTILGERTMTRCEFTIPFALLGCLVSASMVIADEPSARDPLEIFEQRIMPIFRSPEPASCTQCHLSGVGLKDYILPSHEQTFASLRDQGLIDLVEPSKSKILTLIDMGRKDADAQARLIHEDTRAAEYEAFEAWITACCNDPALRNLPQLEATERAKPRVPDEVIRHARKSRVVDSFVRNVWSQRLRCFPCHTPHELDPSNPKHRVAMERHQEFLQRHDGAFAERMKIFKQTPEATLQYLIERSRDPVTGELPLINLEDPRKSLLLLKPTSKLPKKTDDGTFEPPSYSEPVSHMGGLKMHVDDPSYKAFVAWIQDYARVVQGTYTSVDDLPADNWSPTQHVIIVNQVPEAWPDAVRVQLMIHNWNAASGSWASEPVAFTQGPLAPRRIVAGTLFRIGEDRSSHENGVDQSNAETTVRLAPGRYLLKAYIDRTSRLSHDPTILLDDADFVGEVEFHAEWGEGFPKAERVSAKLLN